MGWEMWDQEDIARVLRSVAVAAGMGLWEERGSAVWAWREGYRRGYLAALVAVGEAFGLSRGMKEEIGRQLGISLLLKGGQE